MQYLGGIGIAGFKSFCAEPQYLRYCNKVNVIIGKNNSGKSNILSFLSRKLSALGAILQNPISEHDIKFDELEYCTTLGENPIKISVGFLLGDEAFRVDKLANQLHPEGADFAQRIRKVLTIDESDHLTWLHLEVHHRDGKLRFSPT